MAVLSKNGTEIARFKKIQLTDTGREEVVLSYRSTGLIMVKKTTFKTGEGKVPWTGTWRHWKKIKKGLDVSAVAEKHYSKLQEAGWLRI